MPTTEAEPLDIASATLADRAIVAGILNDARQRLAAMGIDQWTRPFADDWIAARIAAGEFWLARLGGHPVAAARLLWTDPAFWGERERGDAAYVHTMAVASDQTGRGIGAALLRWAEGHARARGRRVLRLDCTADNARLVAYYVQAGFTPVETVAVGGAAMRLFERVLDG